MTYLGEVLKLRYASDMCSAAITFDVKLGHAVDCKHALLIWELVSEKSKAFDVNVPQREPLLNHPNRNLISHMFVSIFEAI